MKKIKHRSFSIYYTVLTLKFAWNKENFEKKEKKLELFLINFITINFTWKFNFDRVSPGVYVWMIHTLHPHHKPIVEYLDLLSKSFSVAALSNISDDGHWVLSDRNRT